MIDIILGIMTVIGPIISGYWSYKSAVKKSQADLRAIELQTKNELEKIKEQAEAEAKLYQEKAAIDFALKLFEHPEAQKMLGKIMPLLIEQELKKQSLK